MLDVHPPKHTPHSWRDFFIHIATIVLGLVIAIGLEQTVEYLHHRHLAAEATSALLHERQIDETANEFNIFGTTRHEHDLQHDLLVLRALRAHQPLPPGPFIVQHVSYIYPDAEWQNIHQSGTINYLSGNLGAITYRYGFQDRFMDLLHRSTEDLARAASVLRSPTDPVKSSYEDDLAFAAFFRRLAAAHEALPGQEIDAAWATLAIPGNVTALSSAQIDSLERAIQIALADDDTMLSDCLTIKRNLARNPTP